ncbi:hypothetical protein CHCC14814_2874 [Bacillus paralicheniformis]|nr:hypothetical protein CHCC14814_2874 [Bacillus paralicheniformis]
MKMFHVFYLVEKGSEAEKAGSFSGFRYFISKTRNHFMLLDINIGAS